MRATPLDRVSPELFARWEELHDADPGACSPFMHPTYVRSAAEVRTDVEVGIITDGDGDEVAGFVPFQRSIMGAGGPVGSRLCDVAGALVRPSTVWDPVSFLRAARLRTLRLPNVPATTGAFTRFQRDGHAAPLMDLSLGFEAYRASRLATGSSFLSQLERKARKLEREQGPLRFEWHTTDDGVFATLLRWKAAQRRQTRTPDILYLPWARALLERLRRQESDGFAGVLSALYAGDTLAAVHFGMRTRRVLHYWVPAYSAELARYSPGVLALVELARAAAERGIQRIDLGSGDERYKLQAATGSVDMTLMTVSTSPTVRAYASTLDHARVWSRNSRVGSVLRTAGRSLVRGSYLVQSALESSKWRADATFGGDGGPRSAP
jgi:CelD/BcsL family acetyltransferase involved in cellulose biosynthesis